MGPFDLTQVERWSRPLFWYRCESYLFYTRELIIANAVGLTPVPVQRKQPEFISCEQRSGQLEPILQDKAPRSSDSAGWYWRGVIDNPHEALVSHCALRQQDQPERALNFVRTLSEHLEASIPR